MPTPSKPVSILALEKKSHRTKNELNQRKQAEQALTTGTALKERSEVKNNPIAHKEFKRLNELLRKIQKNDAIYEGIINRYCIMTAECSEFEEMKYKIVNDIDDLQERLVEKEIEYLDYLEHKDKLQSKLLALDKQIQSKRKMLLDIEKENIMTIAAALRTIPKAPETKKNALLEALGGAG